jgi:hypothetical protein
VVSGGPAGWHPPDEAERLACIPHASRFELPSAGHMMHWTEPGALAQRLFSFFSEPPVQKARTPVAEPHIGTELPLSAQGVPGSVPSVGHASGAAGRGPDASTHPRTAGGTVLSPVAPPAGQVPVGPTRPAAGIPPQGGGSGGSG